MKYRLYTSMRRAGIAASLLMAWAMAAFAGNQDGAEERFAQAHDAFRAGERVRLAKLGESLQGSEYAGWIEYWQLRLRLEEDDEAGVAGFLEKEEASYLAEKMRGEWLRWLGGHEDWARYEREYPRLAQPDQELSCYALRARLAQLDDASALDEARPLWFALTDPPEACQPLMQRLIDDGKLDREDLWLKLRRLMELKKLRAAQAVARQLPARDAPEARKLAAVIDNPARYLARLPGSFADSRPGRELALSAIARVARGDPAVAASQWRAIERRFDKAERAYAWGQIAWLGALNHRPEALAWYALAAGAPLSEEQLAWQARAALRAQDWPRLTQAVADMPPKLASQPEWLYWAGRALAAQGSPEEATRRYEMIAGQPNFYGNLADEELGRAIVVPPRASPPSAEELAAARANPGLRRALAVLRTDLRIEGVREWVWNLRGMNDRQLLAAAELAHGEGIWDRAINTADRTRAEHDYGLRYLAPFRAQVAAKARDVALDDGWIYGLMRQESRFVMAARSSAGAKGLMQLMPATARWVARKIGLSDYHPSRIADMDTNVTLGTHYLKMVLESLDNQPVLASAAYNAGPGRARKWRADRPLEGAIYAETIPFSETRDYVKKVMSNAVYYAMLFDEQPQSLKVRLGTVGPAGGASAPEMP